MPLLSSARWRAPLAALVIAVSLGTALTGQTDADLFDPSQLQEIRLRMNSRDVERLRAGYLENRFYPADFEWRGTRVRNAALRSRGGGSRNPNKPGLLVEFDRYVTGQTVAGKRAVVLDNLYQDPSMIRERVAMRLFARMGQPASLESFARVYINDDYQGVYGIVEAVDEQLLARWANDPQGSLYEYHWLRPYYFEDLGGELEAYEPFFEARTDVHAATPTLYQPIRDMISAINEPSDTLWRTRVEAHVNLQQLVEQLAIGSFMSEWDGILGYAGINNFYLYRPSGSTQHLFLPWDRDNAFHDDDPSIFRRVDENVLVRRALSYPDLYAYYLDVLEQTAHAAAADGWLENEFRAALNVIDGAYADEPRFPYSIEQHQQEVAFLIEFARTRSRRVLEQVAQARSTSKSQ